MRSPGLGILRVGAPLLLTCVLASAPAGRADGTPVVPASPGGVALLPSDAPRVVLGEPPDGADPPLPPGGTAAPKEPPAADVPELPADAVVARVKGYDVNVRAGPRVDNHALAQLNDGVLLIVLERLAGWVGVRVPIGVPAAVSLEFVEPVGAEAVRVTASRLNLRAAIPEEGRPLPAALRDPAPQGTLLPLLDQRDGWALVLAPEESLVYLHEDYVEILGPVQEHAEALAGARAQRRENLEALARVRREAAALASGQALREAIGETQQALWRLRQEAGFEHAPVVEAANRLEAALAAAPGAPTPVRRLAAALCRDLEGELEMRTARRDAEVARLRGLDPPKVNPPEPAATPRTVRGVIRWEAAEGWRNGGAFVLWQGDSPIHVLELTIGLPPPIPDLRAHADGREHAVTGMVNGDRVFGLPVLVVHRLE